MEIHGIPWCPIGARGAAHGSCLGASNGISWVPLDLRRKHQSGLHARYETIPYNPRPNHVLSRGNRGSQYEPTGKICNSLGISPKFPRTPTGKAGTHRNPWRSFLFSTVFRGFQRESPPTPVGTAMTHGNPRQLHATRTVFRGSPHESPRPPVGTSGTHRSPRQSFPAPAVFRCFPRESPRIPVGTLGTNRNSRLQRPSHGNSR